MASRRLNTRDRPVPRGRGRLTLPAAEWRRGAQREHRGTVDAPSKSVPLAGGVPATRVASDGEESSIAERPAHVPSPTAGQSRTGMAIRSWSGAALQPGVDAGAAVADPQPSEAAQPRAGPLDRPTTAAQPGRGLDPAPGGPRSDPAPTQVGPAAAMTIGRTLIPLKRPATRSLLRVLSRSCPSETLRWADQGTKPTRATRLSHRLALDPIWVLECRL